MFILLFIIIIFTIYFFAQVLRLIYFTFNPNLIRSHCSLYAHPNSSLRFRLFFYRNKDMLNKIEHKDGFFEYFNTLGFISDNFVEGERARVLASVYQLIINKMVWIGFCVIVIREILQKL